MVSTYEGFFTPFHGSLLYSARTPVLTYICKKTSDGPFVVGIFKNFHHKTQGRALSGVYTPPHTHIHIYIYIYIN